MDNLTLTKQSSENELKSYFLGVLELSKSNEEFPVDLDDVWPLVYSRKGHAVDELKQNFIEGYDYVSQVANNQLLPQNRKQVHGGHNKVIYRLSTSCLEYFIARKVRPVFEVYRQVFHKVVNNTVPEQMENDYISQVTRKQLAQMILDAEEEIECQRKEIERQQRKIEHQRNEIAGRKQINKEQHETILEQKSEIGVLGRNIRTLEKKIEEDKSKVNYFNQCAELADSSLLSFRQTAGILGIKERRMIDVLHFHGLIYSTKNGPASYSKYLDKYFVATDGVASNGYYFYQTKITVLGRKYINDNWERMANEYDTYINNKKE